jgi:hypothetical protein
VLPLTRRSFLILSSTAVAAPAAIFGSSDDILLHPRERVAELERSRVLRAAESYLKEEPKTIVSTPAPRSAGGLHDYYSEGDYWWPDPKNPDGPYIRRDGESNPANFTAHRDLLLRFSIQAPALAAAWMLTRRQEFARHAAAHLRAWLIEPSSRMNPNLQYAQAIHGIDTGRSIGVIDTLHLVEAAQAAIVLERGGVLGQSIWEETHAWFAAYLNWLTTSAHGQEEREAKNNHGSCWVLQAAEFATLTGDTNVRNACSERLKNELFPGQIAPDGSFPLELARTKPYSYSLFNLDVLGMSALVLSVAADDLWNYALPDGRSLKSCFRFMAPYIATKHSWPYRHDVEYFGDLPVRQPSLLFASLAYHERAYFDLWQRLDPDPTTQEIIRNHPIRQPLLWMT